MTPGAISAELKTLRGFLAAVTFVAGQVEAWVPQTDPVHMAIGQGLSAVAALAAAIPAIGAHAQQIATDATTIRTAATAQTEQQRTEALRQIATDLQPVLSAFVASKVGQSAESDLATAACGACGELNSLARGAYGFCHSCGALIDSAGTDVARMVADLKANPSKGLTAIPLGQTPPATPAAGPRPGEHP